MNREMIVLQEDIKDRESYGFMAFPTPSQYVKKAKYILEIKNDALDLGEFVIQASHISQIKLSMCTRVVSGAGFGGGLRTTVHFDMDIETNDGNLYLFEVVRPDSFDLIFNWVHHHHITLIDPIGIEKIYQQIEGAGARNKYLSGNFGKFKRKYKLDHPRTTKKEG